MAHATGYDQDCDLCLEVEHRGAWVTGNPGPAGTDQPFSRIIQRRSRFDIISGLGSLVPGYVLLVPHAHVGSVGELSEDGAREIYDAAWEVAERVRHEFGGEIVVLEHGSSGAEADISGGACITHAHVHLFPLDRGTDPTAFLVRDSKCIADISQLRQVARNKRNYYYCAWSSVSGHLHADPDLKHQHARRVWAGLLGKSDEWDWSAAPYLANSLLTATRLRAGARSGHGATNSGPGDSDFRETIEAYDLGASEYATRTREFFADSTLPGEIDWLAENTSGVVLDAGCGIGRDALRFVGKGRTVVALDASKSMLELVPDDDGLSRILGDVRRLPFVRDTIGAIWCSAVLVHLKRAMIAEAFGEFFKVLKRGGLLVAGVKEGEGHEATPMPGVRGYRRHFYYYKMSDLIQLAKTTGFEVVRTWEGREAGANTEPQRWVRVTLRKPGA